MNSDWTPEGKKRWHEHQRKIYKWKAENKVIIDTSHKQKPVSKN